MPKTAYKEEKKSKKKDTRNDQYWLDYVKGYFEESQNARSSNVEKQWMINWAYYRGWHNVKYDIRSGSLVFDSINPLDFYVNEIKTTVRAVRNAVTRTRPEWDVDSIPYSQLEEEERRALGYYLSYLYERLNMKEVLKEGVLYGLITGLGVFQYGYDPELEDGRGSVWVDTFDTFDVYIDPSATGGTDARYVIKAIRKPLSSIKSNKNYENTESLVADNKASESPYKEQLESKTRDNESMSTAMLHEAWCLTDEGIRVITICQGRILRNEISDFEVLPFVFYRPEIIPNEIYSEGWVKDLIPLNKALNHNERSILEYNLLFSKGRFLKDKGAKVSSITNQHGQIISKSRGSEFTQMDMKPMSTTPFRQNESIMRYMQDVGSAHEALTGRVPERVTAARAIEDLVANAYNNLSDPIDNMITVLQELGEAMLKLLYQHQNTRAEFKVKTINGEETFSIVGKEGQIGQNEKGQVIKVPKNPEVIVRITSGVAYTKSAKEESLMRLYMNGIVDRKTVQEGYGLNSEEIEQRLLEQNTQGQITDGEGQPQGQPGQPMGMEQAPGGAMSAPGQQMAGPESIVPMEIYESLSDAGRALIEELAASGLTLSQEFRETPQLIEELAAGTLEVTVTADNVVTPGTAGAVASEQGGEIIAR